MPTQIFDIEINTIDGNVMDLQSLRGKPTLFVNVASECGYTAQYAPLQELHEKYDDRINVVGVPCNDFGGQEPGTSQEIVTFCQKNFGVTFQLLEKVSILSNPHPLYSWLMSKSENGKSDNEVKWNFHKFLIDAEGNLIGSFESGVSPLGETILSHI